MKAIEIFIVSFLMVIFAPPFGAHCQELIPGMVVPNMPMGHSLNGKEPLGSFGDYKGKLVILDFWHTQCSACIAGFPEMNRLQQQFGDKIKIFLVAKNTDAEVNKLFGRLHPEVGNLSIITQDSVWNNLFPHLSNPHHVWISPSGVYKYATFDHNATEQHIATFLKDGAVKLSQKQIGDFDEASLFDQASDLPDKYTEKKSVFLKGYYEYTIGGGVAILEDSVTQFPTTIRGSGLSPLALLKCANFDRVYGYNPGVYGIQNNIRTILEVKDTADLYVPRDNNKVDEWMENNFYGYQIIVKPRSARFVFQSMRADIENILPYEGSVEMRNEKYLALVKISSNVPLQSAGEGKNTIANGFMDFKNTDISQIIRHMNDNAWISKLPIIDETGIHEKVDLKIAIKDFFDLDKLRGVLHRYGLDLVAKESKIPMLVIKDKDRHFEK